MSECPNCGSIEFEEVADQYKEEVRKGDPDLDLLARLAPPTSRASIHGFILGVLLWITLLAPFFAPEGMMLRTTLPFVVLSLIWVPLFLRARTTDHELLAAYRAKLICLNCGTIL